MPNPSRIVPIVVLSLSLALAVTSRPGGAGEIEFPAVADQTLEVSLFASEPMIVTPAGLAVDAEGRAFVVESHTHSPRDDYEGPESDRIKIFVDDDGDGRADLVSVFAEGFEDAMNLAFGRDGSLFVCHRDGVTRLRDSDGDGRADERSRLLKLETEQTYDHSCMLGVVVSPDGETLYASRGNVGGHAYTIIGADGSTVAGYGDGGNVVACDSDGNNVREFATGFWNPFAMAIDRNGRLLCVDNDPDSRGPNRLVHLIEGGDYGFKAFYGPSGRHPYDAWDGELPGTLPMVSGTEEAPSGLLACDFSALPRSYRGDLLATSWGGHVVERFRPRRMGASIVASREPWMTGGDDFRPVGIASGPGGAIYVTDWVRKDYPNHGEGRIWRVAPKAGGVVEPPRPRWSEPEPDEGARAITRLLGMDGREDFDVLIDAVVDEDPFLRSAAVTSMARPVFRHRLGELLNDDRPGVRLGGLLALRRAGVEPDPDTMARLLADPSEPVRLMALIRAGESGLELPGETLRAAVTAEEVSARLVEVYLATLAMLQGEELEAGQAQVPGFRIRREADRELIAGLLRDDTLPDRLRALACRLVSEPDQSGIDDVLIRLVNHPDPELRREAVRTMSRGSGPAIGGALLRIARDRDEPGDLRADALVGLARHPVDRLSEVVPMLEDPEVSVRIEAARALRPPATMPEIRDALERVLDGEGSAATAEQLRFALGEPPAEARPDSVEAWVDRLSEGGNVAAGRRVFLSPTVACSDCHRVEGRGGMIGPDLTAIGRSASREQLIRSILEPSIEIAPEYQGYLVATADGQLFSGLQFHFRSGGRAASLLLQDGREVRFPIDELEQYAPMRESIMPEDLERQMTTGDFRDLLAYLESLR